MASKNVKIRGEEPKETQEAPVEELFDPISVSKVSEPDLVRVIPTQNFKGYCAGRWYQFYKDKPIMVPRWYEEILRRDPTRLRG